MSGYSITDLVDEVRASITIPTGWQRDATCARPDARSSKTLYLWPEREERVPEGTGEMDDGRFTLQLELVQAPIGDAAMTSRLREVSTTLGTAVDNLCDWVLTHRSGTTYEFLSVTDIQYDMTREGFRGAGVVLQGYRLVTS